MQYSLSLSLCTLVLTCLSVYAEPFSPLTCKTHDAYIQCGELPSGIGARYSRSDCKLLLSNSSCKILNIESGSTLSQSQVADAVPKDFEEAAQLCQVQHELAHRADGNGETNRSCSEQKAYTVGYNCMSVFGRKYCSSRDFGWDDVACHKVCLNVLHNELAVVSNACLCDKAPHECNKCLTKCETRSNGIIETLPEFCDKAFLKTKVNSASDCRAITEHYCSHVS